MYRLPFFYDYVTPNYAMPNASITELGIINYLHTRHSNRMQNNDSFFEQSLESKINPLTFVFDNSLGTWPSSAFGTHLMSGPYLEIVEGYEDSVFFGKRHNHRYIYPIKVSPHFNDFTGVTSSGSKLNGEYFWKHISAEVLQDIQHGRALIFLDYAQENFIERDSYCRLHECLKYSGIPKDQIILAFNSFNARELYEKWFPEEERRLQVWDWPWVSANTSYFYDHMAHCRLNQEDLESTRSVLRKNHFLFKIRRPRAHRRAFLYQMYQDNLLEKIDWSWITPVQFNNEHVVGDLGVYWNANYKNQDIEELFKKFPHPLQDEPNDNINTISAWTDRQAEPYKNSYFYLCTETYTSGEYKSVTEKVFKPIANYLPFLFMSFPGALQVLRDLGFQTFSPFVDESYDNEPNEAIRLQMIYSEVKRLCNMSKEEIHAGYWSMRDRLEHNQAVLLTLYKTDHRSLDLIKYLHQRVAPINTEESESHD